MSLYKSSMHHSLKCQTFEAIVFALKTYVLNRSMSEKLLVREKLTFKLFVDKLKIFLENII